MLYLENSQNKAGGLITAGPDLERLTVNTDEKVKGGDTTIDALLEITLSFSAVTEKPTPRQQDDCGFLAEGDGTPLKRQM